MRPLDTEEGYHYRLLDDSIKNIIVEKGIEKGLGVDILLGGALLISTRRWLPLWEGKRRRPSWRVPWRALQAGLGWTPRC